MTPGDQLYLDIYKKVVEHFPKVSPITIILNQNFLGGGGTNSPTTFYYSGAAVQQEQLEEAGYETVNRAIIQGKARKAKRQSSWEYLKTEPGFESEVDGYITNKLAQQFAENGSKAPIFSTLKDYFKTLDKLPEDKFAIRYAERFILGPYFNINVGGDEYVSLPLVKEGAIRGAIHIIFPIAFSAQFKDHSEKLEQLLADIEGLL